MQFKMLATSHNIPLTQHLKKLMSGHVRPHMANFGVKSEGSLFEIGCGADFSVANIIPFTVLHFTTLLSSTLSLAEVSPVTRI
jgi:hypothetical protein